MGSSRPAAATPEDRAATPEDRAAEPDRSWWPPRWAAPAGLFLCLLGLGVSGYLTFEHYTASTSLTCPSGGGAIDCFKVTTSSYSMIHGVPVAVLGLVFFAVMAGLQSPPAWRTPSIAVRTGRLAWCAVGVATALWLIYAELFRIDAICLWCTAVHVLSLLIFVTTVFASLSAADRVDT